MTANGYTRQSSAEIVDGQVINASDSNNEYNALLNAFNGTTGHDHSGGTGLGQKINLTGASIGVTGRLDASVGGIYTTTTDPTATDDTPEFVAGSIWINTTSKEIFRCIDNTSTAAVWRKENGTSSASMPTVTSDLAHGYVRGSIWLYTGVSPSLALICIDATNGAAVWYPLPRGRTGVITGATTIPTTANDNTQGYSQGSIILNSTQGCFYLCTSASTGAATWVSLASGRTYTDTVNPTTTDDSSKGYQVGSIGVNTSTLQAFVAISVGASAANWAAISGTKPGLATTSSQTTGFTAVAGTLYPCDVTSAGFTVTLPASAALNDTLGFIIFGTFPLTLNPNGLKINGNTSSLVITSEQTLIITYSGSTRGWV